MNTKMSKDTKLEFWPSDPNDLRILYFPAMLRDRLAEKIGNKLVGGGVSRGEPMDKRALTYFLSEIQESSLTIVRKDSRLQLPVVPICNYKQQSVRSSQIWAA